jgi:sortase A
MTITEERPATASSDAVHRRRRRAGKPRTKRVPRPRSTTTVVVGWVAAVIAVVAGWFVAYALAISSLQAGHDQAVLYSQFREELSGLSRQAPLGGDIAAGAPVALMTMPSIGLQNEVVVEGTAAGDLESGPGHSRSSVLPGQAGISVIYGRATLFGGPFGGIADAQPGQTITMRTGQGESDYVVEDVRRAGDPFPGPLAAGAGQLTLVSAEGSGWRSGWAPDHVVYVDAALKSKSFPVPPGRVAVVPTSERALQGDPSALYTLILWLPLLAAAGAAVVWAQQRWGRWQAWLVGVPIVLACLWGVSETAVRLMPNLM